VLWASVSPLIQWVSCNKSSPVITVFWSDESVLILFLFGVKSKYPQSMPSRYRYRGNSVNIF
jgi:hypothetical protein